MSASQLDNKCPRTHKFNLGPITFPKKCLLASVYNGFSFVSNNWDQFVHAIPSVNRKVLRLVFNAYDSDGDFVLEESPITFDESSDYSGKFWDICDIDNSGYLNIDEFVYFMNWFGDVFARLIIKVRK